MKCSEDGNFSDGGLQRFGRIELNPAACVLNYGQGISEELKAYKKLDNSIVLFRPEENGLRTRMGAERMCMPAPTVEQFVEAACETYCIGFLHQIKAFYISNHYLWGMDLFLVLNQLQNSPFSFMLLRWGTTLRGDWNQSTQST